MLVTPGCVSTRDIHIESGVIVNHHAPVGHDGTVGAFVFIGPGSVLTGDGAVIVTWRSVGANA